MPQHVRQQRKTRRKTSKLFRKSRRLRKQKGGKLLGSGTFGSAFRPPPCTPATAPAGNPDSYIGKLMKKKAAKAEREQVKKILSALKTDKGNPILDADYFLLPYVGECVPDPANPDIVALGLSPEKLAKRKVLLYSYGGTTLYDFQTTLLTKQKTPDAMNKQLENFLSQLRVLFAAIRLLYVSRIVHSDIKSDNVVVGEASFPNVGLIRLIDFGNAFLQSEINSGEHFYGVEQTDSSIWPPEACFAMTRAGFPVLFTKNLESTKAHIFGTEGKRDRYLQLLGFSIDTPAELEAAKDRVVREMRDGVQAILNKILNEKDVGGSYIHEGYIPIFAVDPAAETLIFNIDEIENHIDETIDEVEVDIQRFLKELLERARAECIMKVDVFSTGLLVAEVLEYIVGNAAASGWRVSDATTGAYVNEVLAICRRMIHPNQDTRLNAVDAFDALTRIGLFEVALPPGYKAVGAGPAGGASGGAK